ncbi:thioredoxin isoform X1 [Betta splendens]|uniref:Thioredoxin isoform X1 n=1 Tax=Betta splendens TaxID=158456 RepID=A0A8M1H1V4_BETSP|nr:thioredoxin isoform X1 [Betta splendens]
MNDAALFAHTDHLGGSDANGMGLANQCFQLPDLGCGPSAAGRALDASGWDDFKKILKEAGDKLVVVDFTATWCGPCKQIGPIFVKMSEDPANKDIVFLKVDVDEAEDVSSSCGISCMPTFHFYKNGEKVDEFSGANAKQLSEALEKNR